METKEARRILTAPDTKPYPEKLENLLTIEEAAEIWNTPAVTIRKKCKEGFFGHFARKMGGQWIITPEAMLIWKGNPQNSEHIISPYWKYDRIKSAFRTLEMRNRICKDAFIAIALTKLYGFMKATFPETNMKNIKEPNIQV